MSNTIEKTFYDPIVDSSIHMGLEDFNPEDFVPAQGSILVVLPPPAKETKGGIHLPDQAVEAHCVARVASSPQDAPYHPGDWVVFQKDTGLPFPLQNRKDLLILKYTSGPDSEVLGHFPSAD